VQPKHSQVSHLSIQDKLDIDNIQEARNHHITGVPTPQTTPNINRTGTVPWMLSLHYFFMSPITYIITMTKCLGDRRLGDDDFEVFRS
jgi:hypothetical protein